jgi:hypothetical protein
MSTLHERFVGMKIFALILACTALHAEDGFVYNELVRTGVYWENCVDRIMECNSIILLMESNDIPSTSAKTWQMIDEDLVAVSHSKGFIRKENLSLINHRELTDKITMEGLRRVLLKRDAIKQIQSSTDREKEIQSLKQIKSISDLLTEIPDWKVPKTP